MARKTLWVFFVLLMGIALLFAGGLNSAYENSAQDYRVENESVTQDFQNLQYVDKADTAQSFNESVTVYNSSQVELTDGTDYDWYTNGSIQFYNTSSTTEGNTATVTYEYSDQSESSEFGGTAMRLFGKFILLLVLLVAGRFVFKSLWGWD